MSDETGPEQGVEQPEPAEQSDGVVLPAWGCAGAGCFGAVVGFVVGLLLAIGQSRTSADTIMPDLQWLWLAVSRGACGAVVGGLVGAAVWVLWNTIESAKRRGS